MAIKGYEEAKKIAVERVKRMKEPLCVVHIGNDEYVLWREKTIDGVSLVYPNAYVITTIRIKQQ